MSEENTTANSSAVPLTGGEQSTQSPIDRGGYSIPHDINTKTQYESHADAETQAKQEALKNFQSFIPEEYADKPYMEKFKEPDTFFKAFDNLQKMQGRPAIPTENSSKEEWDQFYNQLGRPQEPSAYRELIPEGLGVDDELFNEFSGMAHELGLTKTQVQKLIEYDASRQQKYMESQRQQQEQLGKDFDTQAQKMFGEKWEQVIDRTGALARKFAPEGTMEKMMQTDNPSLLAFMSILDGISKEYLSEDTFTSSGATTPQMDPDAINNEIKKLMAEQYHQSVVDPKFKENQKRIKELRAMQGYKVK